MNQIKRRESKEISIGWVKVGGNAPITVQSMTKTDTRDPEKTLTEIKRLAISGCEIIRLAVPDVTAAKALRDIVPLSPIPVIADIHFDHQLALISMENKVHGLRINPGNIRDKGKIREIAQTAKKLKIPIRVGVNAGSLDVAIAEKFGGVSAEALAASALEEVEILEGEGFDLIKIGIKAFEVDLMVNAVRKVASLCKYPLHLGITEAGLPEDGIIRSAIGIGALLLEGIGDTIRVSLTGDSVEEVTTGIKILRSLGLRKDSPIIISCPTCGRCNISLIQMAQNVAQKVKDIKLGLKIAVMGCEVNGPGEAKQADFGIAGGKKSGLIFRKGKVVRQLPADQLVDGLLEEIYRDLELTHSLSSQIKDNE